MLKKIFASVSPALLLSLLLLGMHVPEAAANPAAQGVWSTLPNLVPINPIHAALSPNGKVLIVAGSGNCPAIQTGCPPTGPGAQYGPSNGSGAALYDPPSGTFTQFTLSWNMFGDMFCTDMVLLPDGRALIVGGTLAYDPFKGQVNTTIFDPSTNTFTNVQNMLHGRWYPTVTTLGDGRAMTFSGLDENNNINNTVEIYDVGSGWSPPQVANWTPSLYPADAPSSEWQGVLLGAGRRFLFVRPADGYVVVRHLFPLRLARIWHLCSASVDPGEQL